MDAPLSGKRREIMKTLNLVKIEEALKFFGDIKYYQNMKISENFVEEVLNFDGSIDIIMYSPDAGTDYTAATVAAEEVPYYLGTKAMPGGVATPFQRFLGWKVVKKLAASMVSKIENDTIELEELITLSRVSFDDKLFESELRRAISKWIARNEKSGLLTKQSTRDVRRGHIRNSECYFAVANNEYLLQPARYGSGKVVHVFRPRTINH